MKYLPVKYSYQVDNGLDTEGKQIIETKEKELRLRLSADSCIEIETQRGQGLIDYVQNETVEMCVTMLQHMMKFDEPNYNISQAKKLYDSLVDNGWTKKRMIVEIIYEALVISGFFTKEELNKMLELTDTMNKVMEEKQMEVLQNL